MLRSEVLRKTVEPSPTTAMVLERKELLRRKAECPFLPDESKRDIFSKGITRGRLIVLGYTALPVAFLILFYI